VDVFFLAHQSTTVLLDRILVPDPERRYTIEDIEKNPWFSVYVLLFLWRRAGLQHQY
jgi:hypothetical protein